MCIATCMSAAIRAKEKMEYTASGTLLHKCILLLCVFITIKMNTGITGIVWSYVIASFFLEAYYLICLHLKFNIKLSLSFNITDILKIIKKAFPLGMGMLYRRISLQSEIILLNLMHEPSSAGVFAAVFKLFQPLQQMAQIISVIFLPFLSRHHKTNTKHIIFIITVFLCSCLMALIIYFFSPFLKLILGPKYDFSLSSTIFKILIFAIPAFFCIPFIFCVLLAKRMERFWMIGNFTAVLINVIFSICLISFFKIHGAAFSRVIIEWFLALTLLFFLIRSSS